MRKTGSLRGRWIMNTVGVVAILGFLCAAAVTAVFAVYYYSAMESDMQYRARNTTDFFAEYSNLDYNNYYQSCIHYANRKICRKTAHWKQQMEHPVRNF